MRVEDDGPDRRHGSQAEQGLDERHDRAGRPGLGRTRVGVNTGMWVVLDARQAADDLGEAVALKQGRGSEGGLREPVKLRPEAVAGESEGRGAGLYRPDTAAVVRERVVRRMVRREGTDPPPAEHVRGEQPAGDGGG